MKQHSKEEVEATANAIMEHFIPKDANQMDLTFHFTIPPSSNYKVAYQKDKNGQWNFASFELDDIK